MAARRLLISLVATLAACGDNVAVPAVEPLVTACGPRPAIEHAVTRDGTGLVLDGKPFRVLGANAYYLQQLFSYAKASPQTAAQATRALDDMTCLSMNVVRTLGFNDTEDMAAIRKAPGQYEEAGLVALDRAVFEAKARGLRVILPLTNNWPDFGGLDAYARWAGKSHDDFFGDATMMGYWKDYATTLLGRVNTLTGVAYRDEPAILGWEVANELRCRGCRGTTRYVDTIAALARHLRAAGATQLVLDGGEGYDDAAAEYAGLSATRLVDGEDGASFHGVAAIPEIDLVSIHLYPEVYGLSRKNDVPTWIDAHVRLARAAGKIAYLGEFGSDPTWTDDVAARDRLRAPVYDKWLERFYVADTGVAALLWQVIPTERRSMDDGYAVVYGEDHLTARVLHDWAVRVTGGP
jgi:mannan endo-1,4-beta-mannosidase